jgi:hypothetical protein
MFSKITNLVVALFVCTVCFAQKNTEYHLLSLSAGNDQAAVPMAFYVAGVFDGRQFTDNIGTVQKGIANRPVLARFEKPFLDEITQYLTTAYPKKENAYPVWVRVNDLYISEYTDMNEETGYAAVVMDVMIKRNDSLFIEGTYGANIEGTGMDVTKKHALRIKQALNKCLGLYEVALPEDKLAEAFTQDLTKRDIPLKPAKGVYVSYLDMVKNKPLATDIYYLKPEKEKFYIINSMNSQRSDDFFAYSDGENVYLNVRKFTNEKYYVKTERIANKYYVDKIAYDQNKAISQVAMYELFGYFAGKIIDDVTMPMLIDCYSGQPFFLSKSGIKTLLEPHPDLLAEYKKSKKTPDDIKSIVKKYYELHSVKN